MDLNTYLFFDGQCEDAFKLYERVLGGRIVGLMRYAFSSTRSPTRTAG